MIIAIVILKACGWFNIPWYPLPLLWYLISVINTNNVLSAEKEAKSPKKPLVILFHLGFSAHSARSQNSMANDTLN